MELFTVRLTQTSKPALNIIKPELCVCVYVHVCPCECVGLVCVCVGMIEYIIFFVAKSSIKHNPNTNQTFCGDVPLVLKKMCLF